MTMKNFMINIEADVLSRLPGVGDNIVFESVLNCIMIMMVVPQRWTLCWPDLSIRVT